MERREKYLQAALQLFAEHGFVGTTTDMIVARVGGSKATLYRHFPNKEALVAGLMDQLAAAMNRSAPAAGLEELSLRDALTRIGTEVLVGVTSERAVTLLRLCLGEYGRFPELAKTVWDHGPTVTYANFRKFLQRRQRRGEVAVEDTQLAAEHFMGAIVGHIQLKVAMGMAEPPGERDCRRRVKGAVETFLARYERT